MALDVQIQATVTTALYVRHSISFVAEPNDQMRATALLYVPTMATKWLEDRDTDSATTDAAAAPAPSLPCILALQPTSPAGSAWSEVRLPPLNYAAELAGQGYVVIAPD